MKGWIEVISFGEKSLLRISMLSRIGSDGENDSDGRPVVEVSSVGVDWTYWYRATREELIALIEEEREG